MRSGEYASRRRFLELTGAAGAALVASACGRRSSAAGVTATHSAENAGESGPAEVSTNEDLMREHGVLRRALLVYDETERWLLARSGFLPDPLARTARLIQSFVHDYHEKLEEQHLFPRFQSAGDLTDLVAVLLAQHEAGRRVTAAILGLADAGTARSEADSQRLAGLLRSFTRMYRPHAAREDTVLFPALHRIVSAREYDALGEQFEDEERRRFGADGFAKAVSEIAGVEKDLGLEDLRQFTPHV